MGFSVPLQLLASMTAEASSIQRLSPAGAPSVGVHNVSPPASEEKIPLWLLILTEPVLWLFHALHTVKSGLVILGLLAVVSIVGSVISANGDLGPEYAKQLVFNTWWFLALMGLLCINLVLATWDRSIAALTLFKKAAFREAPAFYEKSQHSAAIPFQGTAEDLEAILRKEYTVVRRKGTAFYAQRGLLSRTGFTIIHIGLLATMASGFYRILADEFRFGVFDGTVILPEGLTTENYFTRKDRLQKPTGANLDMHDLPFQLRLLNFHVENHPGSTVAKKYSSLIELRDPQTGFAKIAEVTMETPILYKGFKVTQNSYSPTDKVKRGRFLVVDRKEGKTYDLDAASRDPVMLDAVRHSHGLFLQVDGLAATAGYSIVDLANQSVVAQGMVEPSRAAGPIPLDLTPHAAALADSKYGFLVAALFPHFAIDSSGNPTTLSEQFVNPAVLIMIFKNGRPNGYLWLFQSEEASRIMGQPHPEIAARFDAWRIKEGRDGSQGFMDYEVNIGFVDKSTSRSIDTFWSTPGRLMEIAGIDPQVLSRPNVTDDDVSLRRRGGSGNGFLGGGLAETTGSVITRPSSDATMPSLIGTDSKDRFQVIFLGTVDGHVSYLGFMRDPSVVWIYLGCLIIVGGTLIAWLICYREAWFFLNPDAGSLYMATQVRGYGRRAHEKFDRLVDRLANRRFPLHK